MSRYNNEGKVYVGDLPRDATESELDRAFSYYGPIRNIWISRHPAGFAFIEFEDIRDAEDSVRDLNGSKICGVRARVEMSNGGRRSGGGGGGGRYGGGGAPRGRPFDPNDRCYQCGERGHYAYDCRSKGARGGGRRYSGEDRGRSRSYERRRSYSRSRSRGRRSYSRSRSGSR